MASQQENLSEKIILSENNKKFMVEWENTKSKGFWKFVFTEGFAVGSIVAIVSFILQEKYNNSWTSILTFFCVFLFVFVAIYAPTMWTINENKYKKLQNKNN